MEGIMKVILVKADGSKEEEYDNVIKFNSKKIVCSAGRGIMTIFAGNGEYYKIKNEEDSNE